MFCPYPRHDPRHTGPLLADLIAALAVSRKLIRLDWHIGCAISRTRQDGSFGANVVERLAKDLAARFPEMGGFYYPKNRS